MPIFTDYSICKFEDGVLTIQLVNPTPIGGWSLRADFTKRLGGTPRVTKWISSGTPNGASGITITDSGQGVFRIALDSADTSGLAYGNYAFDVRRTDSGFVTDIAQGYQMVFPGG